MKKLSIITPLYNTSDEYLNDVIDSVKKYSNEIELILINDSPNNINLKKRLNDLSKQEYITIYTHEYNKGIFEAYMTGFLNASGEYVCILDHDDVFNPINVLYATSDNPDLIYTDEYKYYYDKNNKKIIYDVYDKPQFDILSSVNYLYTHHVTAIKTDVIKKRLSAYNNNLNFTSIFDIHMMLEYLTCLNKDSTVVHIQSADYGWRMHENSTASNLEQKLSGYYERLKKVEEFYKYYDELPRLRLNPRIPYLVDAYFTSVFDEFDLELGKEGLNNAFSEKSVIESPSHKMEIYGEYNDLLIEHYFNILRRIPLKYLTEKQCMPIVITSEDYMKTCDKENYDRHVAGTVFISEIEEIPEDCIIISDKEEKELEKKYIIIEKAE